MKISYIVIALMALIGFSACAEPTAKATKYNCPELIKPDGKITSVLGNRLTDIIFSPKSVSCFYITPVDSIRKGDVELEPNIVKKEKLSQLSKEEIAVLQYVLLSDSNSYKNDSIVVLSPYIPCLDFEFEKKKETAHVLISLSDFSWSIVYDGKKQFNHNYHSNEIERLCAFYLSKLNDSKQEKK